MSRRAAPARKRVLAVCVVVVCARIGEKAAATRANKQASRMSRARCDQVDQSRAFILNSSVDCGVDRASEAYLREDLAGRLRAAYHLEIARATDVVLQVVVVLLSRESSHYFLERCFGLRFNLFFRLILNRMLYVDGVEADSSEGAGLGSSSCHELVGGDGNGRHTEQLQLCRVVQTARRTRSSVGKRFYHPVTACCDEMIDYLRGRGL